MSIAEMKLAAMNHLLHLESEKAIETILRQLETLAKEDAHNRSEKIDSIFNDASAQ